MLFAVLNETSPLLFDVWCQVDGHARPHGYAKGCVAFATSATHAIVWHCTKRRWKWLSTQHIVHPRNLWHAQNDPCTLFDAREL